MKYVYLLESLTEPDKKYIGLTSDLTKRLEEHNAGKSPHTAKFRPWKVVVAIRFDNDLKAAKFEQYLKSGSGHAFSHRHFW
ncbi:MAG TPA: GIY-YIG nuclease family protein [Anaerohalosphaeraceae bacterium]|nr:GIY-YIG nuclease family protein [Anaerohalosphaeraceae bacterium]HPP55218.1 GIY-YIG nuclease family protein [Anaerohalosphaeraceae bacterium]